uniref:Zinc finger, RING-type n=1 Tax=Solanum tuberosum TaxID=4113 RepID=M1CQ20_SOLTU
MAETNLESGRLSVSAGVICVWRRERQGSSSSTVWSFHEVMVDRWFGTSWATPRTVKLKESLFSWKDRKKRRRHRAWNVVPLELIWVVWRERNMSAFEGVKSSFSQ